MASATSGQTTVTAPSTAQMYCRVTHMSVPQSATFKAKDNNAANTACCRRENMAHKLDGARMARFVHAKTSFPALT